MREVVLARNSWHRWCALRSGKLSTSADSVDICSYTWMVVYGGISALLAYAILTIFAIVGVAAAAVMVFAILRGGYLVFTSSGVSPLAMIGSLPSKTDAVSVLVFITAMPSAALASPILFVPWLRARWLDWCNSRREVNRVKPAGFIRTALTAWKQKVCFKVRFVQDR